MPSVAVLHEAVLVDPCQSVSKPFIPTTLDEAKQLSMLTRTSFVGGGTLQALGQLNCSDRMTQEDEDHGRRTLDICKDLGLACEMGPI